jgi:Tfp pilus assembly major pilin PilA
MTDTNSPQGNKQKGKFSIIDLLMMIMIVGVILTIILPLQQTRKHEAIVRASLIEMEKVIRANEYFKLYSGWDEYAMDITQLRDFSHRYLSDLDTSIFTFTVNDTSIIATTKHIGRYDASYWLDLRDGMIRVSDDSRDVIIPAWLPQRIQ